MRGCARRQTTSAALTGTTRITEPSRNGDHSPTSMTSRPATAVPTDQPGASAVVTQVNASAPPPGASTSRPSKVDIAAGPTARPATTSSAASVAAPSPARPARAARRTRAPRSGSAPARGAASGGRRTRSRRRRCRARTRRAAARRASPSPTRRRPSARRPGRGRWRRRAGPRSTSSPMNPRLSRSLGIGCGCACVDGAPAPLDDQRGRDDRPDGADRSGVQTASAKSSPASAGPATWPTSLISDVIA